MYGQAQPAAPSFASPPDVPASGVVGKARLINDVALEVLARAKGVAATIRGPVPENCSTGEPIKRIPCLGASLEDLLNTLTSTNQQLLEIQEELGRG